MTGHGRVLVVDDDPGVLDMLRENLEHLGYQASTAASVEQAIIAMARVRPDVVLLDLGMPRMSGLEALTYFRQHHRPVPVIVITGDRREESAQKARAAGALAVVLKPFDLPALEILVAQAIRGAPGA